MTDPLAPIWTAWLFYVRKWEGVTLWMYLDTKGKVTTGIGFLINTLASAQALPWIVKSTGRRATAAEIATEWNRVRALQDWKRFNGLNARWRDSAKLVLPSSVVDDKLRQMTPQYYAGAKRAVPALDSYPADAKLAVLDEAWQNGPAYLLNWRETRVALLLRDFAAAAQAVPGTGPRAEFRRRLFRNAAVVEDHDMNPNTLWDTIVPEIPPQEGSYDMTAALPLYRTNGVDQTIAEGETKTLTIGVNETTKKGEVTIVSGPNSGVDVGVVALFNCEKPTNVALWLALIDTKTDGSDAKPTAATERAHGKLQFAAGTGWEIKAEWRGEIPKHKTAGRQYRLRVRAWANGPVDVTLVQYSGWKMP